MQVPRIDGRQRRSSQLLLSQAFREKLIVPEANRFQCFRPDGKHANVHAASRFEQMAYADVVQNHVLAQRSRAEMLVHRRGPLQQSHGVQSQDGGR